MSEFTNTIDVLGDDAVMDSIIQRTITEFKDNRVQTVGHYAFYQCISLDTVDLPNATKVDSNAFDGCTALNSANFPKVTEIGGNVFKNCKSLTEVDLPVATTIGGAAFDICSSLNRVNIPIATAVQDGAFQNCEALTYVDLPCVKILRSSVFNNCKQLATLILRVTSGVATMVHTNALNYTAIASGAGYVYVPKALVDSYKAATNWSTYANQIRAIEDYPDITGG